MSQMSNLHAVLSTLAAEYVANNGRLTTETEVAVTEALGTDDWEVAEDTVHCCLTVRTVAGQEHAAYYYPLKPDLTIGVGDRVRSYDFVGNIECYAEGTVTGFREYEGCMRYVLNATARVFGSEWVPKVSPQEVYPPVNGTPSSLWGVCRGVVRAR